MDMFSLCYKCGGNLSEDNRLLYGCSCINSGRDFNDWLRLDDAAVEQRKRLAQELRLYRRQGRSLFDIKRLTDNRRAVTRQTTGDDKLTSAAFEARHGVDHFYA